MDLILQTVLHSSGSISLYHITLIRIDQTSLLLFAAGEVTLTYHNAHILSSATSCALGLICYISPGRGQRLGSPLPDIVTFFQLSFPQAFFHRFGVMRRFVRMGLGNFKLCILPDVAYIISHDLPDVNMVFIFFQNFSSTYFTSFF